MPSQSMLCRESGRLEVLCKEDRSCYIFIKRQFTRLSKLFAAVAERLIEMHMRKAF